MHKYLVYFLVVLLQLFQAIIVLAVTGPTVCFDVLDQLPSNEVKKIYFMNFKEVAHTHPAADILSCFLQASHPRDKSITEQYFDVYKKCDYFKESNFQPFGNQQLEELISLGLPYYLENDLRKSMKTGSKEELAEGIIHVQAAINNEIELSREFKYYKELILQKIKPHQNTDSSPLNGYINSCSRENLLEFFSKGKLF